MMIMVSSCWQKRALFIASLGCLLSCLPVVQAAVRHPDVARTSIFEQEKRFWAQIDVAQYHVLVEQQRQHWDTRFLQKATPRKTMTTRHHKMMMYGKGKGSMTSTMSVMSYNNKGKGGSSSMSMMSYKGKGKGGSSSMSMMSFKGKGKGGSMFMMGTGKGKGTTETPPPRPPPENRMMLASDNSLQPNPFYLKEFAYRGEGKHVEIWIALDVSFPWGDEDCRNTLGLTDIGDEQLQSVIDEFDNNIYPTMSQGFSVAPPRHGNDTTMQEFFAEQLGLDCCTQALGDGEKILVLVDNIRDNNYYAPNTTSGQTYNAGFVSPLFTEFHDRNVFVLDVYDWVHRTGKNPPDDSNDPEYTACTEWLGGGRLGRPRPNLYESVFAHEYYHLLSSYPGFKDTWLEEAMSNYAEVYTGYADPLLDPEDMGFPDLMKVFLGFENTSSDLGGPEQSLTRWLDQGPTEILADYGVAWTFILYVADRYGHDFLSAFHLNGDATDIAGFDAQLALEGETERFVDVLPLWQAALVTAGQINTGSSLISSTYAKQDLEFMSLPLSKVNWTTPQAYNSPGAPTNGADFVRLRDVSGAYLAADEIQSLQFMGATDFPTIAQFAQRGNSIATRPGNNINSIIQREFDLSGGGQIAVTMQWTIEPFKDFFVVQVYDEGIGDFVSLESEHTTTRTQGLFEEYLPAITNSSGGVITSTFDASAYATKGQVMVGLRHLTDSDVVYPGVRIFGLSIDGIDVADGADYATWSVVPLLVYDWSLVLVSYTEDDSNQPVFINDVPLTNFMASLNKAQVEELIGSTGEFVGAKVTVVDPSGEIEEYAEYNLIVNGFVQPGGA